MLVYMVQNRERVVTKDDLLDAVWSGRFVSESNLTTRINAARKAVGDSGQEQRLIRTIARKGFRFVGVVSTAAENARDAPTSTAPTGMPLPLPDKPSIAVLPFQNMSGDPEQEYFADGVVEEIITALSRVHWLFVIARNSSFTYKGRAVDIKLVGRELGVRYVLEGSVRKASNRVRITGQLVDATTGAHASAYGIAAWCVCLSKSNGWLFDPEREIAEGVRLARRAVAVGKDDPTALWSGGINLAYLAAELETGAAYIDRAIVVNPNLAAAWSASGWLRIYLGEPASAIERLERSRRLSPLDPIAYMGYAGMALALLLADRYDEAVSWAAKAINEQPNWAMPLRVAAIAYALSDRIVEAREAMARLREFDPTLRLSNLERVAPPFRRPEDRARYADGLRRAGLPE
ncbi:MAG: winged helix-turn-helix domain-containing protein [Xanthobacteraceae bacterium]